MCVSDANLIAPKMKIKEEVKKKKAPHRPNLGARTKSILIMEQNWYQRYRADLQIRHNAVYNTADSNKVAQRNIEWECA